ncbi:MAG: hypothetical protein RSA41_06380 [Christensenella sp.]
MYVDDAPYIKNAMLTGECGMYSTPWSAECLEDKSRDAPYQKCKEKGLQIVAAKTTNDNELVVTEL